MFHRGLMLTLADGPQMIGTVTRGMAARTLTATAGAPMIVEELAASRNGIGVVTWVAGNAMVIEAATTKPIIEATTKRRAKARDIFEHTLRHIALLRAAAVSRSTTGGKRPILTTTKCAGANLLLRVRGHGPLLMLGMMPIWPPTMPTGTSLQLRARGTSLQLRVRGPGPLLILVHQRGEAPRCSTRQPIAAFVPRLKMIISHGRVSSIAVNRKFTPHH